jgi:hypothetical protein
VIVAAPGPSLSSNIAEQCRAHRTIAVQDAWRLMPWADVLYACDLKWWRAHDGCKAFAGERWSTHDTGNNDKREAAKSYGVRLVAGKPGSVFSTDPALIRYGNNSGFQGVNFAILSGASRIVMVGFDMQGSHFFGDHPKPLRNPSNFATFIRAFETAAKSLPAGVEIVNATPGSALKCFPIVPLDEAMGGHRAAA